MRPSTGIKKEYLSMMWAMEICGALPEFGAKAKHTRRSTQSALAEMQGVRRETVNRRIARMSAPSHWSEEDRGNHSRKMLEIAKDKGLKLRGRERRAIKRVGVFLHRSRGFAEACEYTHLPADLRPTHTTGKGSMGKPTAQAELLAGLYGKESFDPEACWNGFKEIDGLLWHPNLPDVQECECQAGQLPLDAGKPCPKCEGTGEVFKGSLPDFARVLATLLICLRIKDAIPGVKAANELVITQKQLADLMGCDVNTVAKYEHTLESLMIIRTVYGEVHRNDKGQVTERDPHKIIWVLDKLMDQETAEREANRFARACRSAQEAGGDGLAVDRAAHVFGELLRAWQGKEHCLQAFYNEMRRRLISAGISRELQGSLFPLARE
jgi:transcriptional regulator with XRE-family HTH domain